MKTQLTSFLILCLALTVFISGCKKDDDFTDVPPESTTETNEVIALENSQFANVMATSEINTSLTGTIYDESGNVLSGVTVSSNANSTLTDENGFFLIRNVDVNAQFAVIKAEKIGYLDGFKTFTPSDSPLNRIEMWMLAEGASSNVNAVSGGEVTIDNEISLNFPENSVVKENGDLYTGNVIVKGRYISPDSENLASIMPGLLLGLNNESGLNPLISYGMMGVELEDEAGNELQVANGKTVEVDLPASSNAPESIPFWHFNETYGLWIEAGTATKVGDRYFGSANHFSYWNVDFPIDNGNGGEGNGEDDSEINVLDILLVTEDGVPLTYYSFQVYFEDQNIFQAVTNGLGEATLSGLPPVVEIVLNVCGSNYTTTVATDVGSVIIEMDLDMTGASMHTFSGQLSGCDGESELVFDDEFYLFNIDFPEFSGLLSGLADSDGHHTETVLLCNIDNDIEYAAQFIVLVNGSVLTEDFTINIPDGINNHTLDFDFCDSEISEIDPDFPIPFTDFNFELAVRGVLNIPTAPIVYADVFELLALSLTFEQINSIDGIQYFTNLTSLDLTTNNIINISGISDLENLIELNIDNNQVEDISALAQLTNLETLIMPINNIFDLTPLAGLANLTYLDFSYNQVTSVGPLNNLLNLTYIDGSGNQISTIAPITFLSNLEELYLDENIMTNVLTDMSAMTNLNSLTLRANSTFDVLGMSGLPNLNYVDLSDNQLIDILPLSGVPSLVELDLGENFIVDLTPLSGLSDLTDLSLNNNEIEELTGLSGLVGLEDVNLNANMISDVAPLAGLTNLIDLQLSNNFISDVSTLCGLGPTFSGSIFLSFNGLDANDIAPLNTCLPLANIVP